MERIMIVCLLWTILIATKLTLVSGSECMKRKFFEIHVNYFGGVTINRTLKCDMYFQWTVADYCCYDKYDRFERHPYCCYSETYKLVLAVGFICLVLLGCSFSIFLCWIYNLPHYLLYCITCGKFSLNEWTVRNKNSPYVDPSFYSGEPFWAKGGEMQQLYPLRPMPPKVFYPAPPPKLKYRWDMAHGELPLFIVASRQFTRNPYSARPQDRNTTPNYHDSNNNNESRRNSLNSVNEAKKCRADDNKSQSQGNYSAQYNRHRRGHTASSTRKFTPDSVSSASSRRSVPDNVQYNPPPFGANIDEVDAAQELMEALKFFDDEDRNNPSPVQWKNENKQKNEEQKSTNGRQDIFIISGNNSVMSCPPSGSNGGSRRQGLDFENIRPNTTGSVATFEQYGNYMALSQLGLSDSQRLKISTRGGSSNNPLGVQVYSMPGVHTAGVLSTVQNYHVVSSNLGNPMETILEDDSMDEQPTKSEMNESESSALSSSPSSPTSSRSSKPGSGRNSSISNSVASSSVKATARFNAQREQRQARLQMAIDESKPSNLKRRASSIATVSTGVGGSSRAAVIGSPVMSSSINHVLGPTPTITTITPFNPTLPGTLDESCYDTDAKSNKPRRNSVI